MLEILALLPATDVLALDDLDVVSESTDDEQIKACVPSRKGQIGLARLRADAEGLGFWTEFGGRSTRLAVSGR